MLKRLMVIVVLGMTLLSGAGALAQAQPGPSAEDMAMIQQMQGVFQTMLQKMQEKGIDPQQFFQQMQNGTDPAEIQQKLIDEGILDQQTINMMQANIQKFALRQVKTILNASDDEWKVLEPIVLKVMSAAAALDRTPGGGLGGILTDTTPAGLELSKAAREVRAAIKDQTTPPERFGVLLATYRDAREKVQSELTAARAELVAVLTVRQESELSSAGIVP